MMDHHELGDHAAHRGPHDMSALDAKRVEQAGAVRGHVVERIGRVDRLAGHGLGHQLVDPRNALV